MIQSPTMIAKTESTTSELTGGIDPAWTRPWLRAEGLATFAAGLAGFLLPRPSVVGRSRSC